MPTDNPTTTSLNPKESTPTESEESLNEKLPSLNESGSEPLQETQKASSSTTQNQTSSQNSQPSDPFESVYQAHHDDAMRVILEGYHASDSHEVLQQVFSKKLRVLRAGSSGNEVTPKSQITEQIAMEMVRDHQLRMRRELAELSDNIFRLEAFIDHDTKIQMSDDENLVTKHFQMSLMQSQLDAMRQYHSILSTRVIREERYQAHDLSTKVEKAMDQMNAAQKASPQH